MLNFIFESNLKFLKIVYFSLASMLAGWHGKRSCRKDTTLLCFACVWRTLLCNVQFKKLKH